jgi:hypothetical protein
MEVREHQQQQQTRQQQPQQPQEQQEQQQQHEQQERFTEACSCRTAAIAAEGQAWTCVARVRRAHPEAAGEGEGEGEAVEPEQALVVQHSLHLFEGDA